MGFWKWLKEVFVGRRIVDPVFGEMFPGHVSALPGSAYEREEIPLPKIWHGRVLFAPLQREIGIIAVGDDSAPRESTHALFREIERRWPEIEIPVREALFEPLRTWIKDDAELCAKVRSAEHVPDVLQLIGIGLRISEHTDFELAYSDIKGTRGHEIFGGDHDLVVHFKDWKIILAAVEG